MKKTIKITKRELILYKMGMHETLIMKQSLHIIYILPSLPSYLNDQLKSLLKFDYTNAINDDDIYMEVIVS